MLLRVSVWPQYWAIEAKRQQAAHKDFEVFVVRERTVSCKKIHSPSARRHRGGRGCNHLVGGLWETITQSCSLIRRVGWRWTVLTAGRRQTSPSCLITLSPYRGRWFDIDLAWRGPRAHPAYCPSPLSSPEPRGGFCASCIFLPLRLCGGLRPECWTGACDSADTLSCFPMKLLFFQAPRTEKNFIHLSIYAPLFLFFPIPPPLSLSASFCIFLFRYLGRNVQQCSHAVAGN